MSPSLTYFPAYLGLLAAQVLAVACNAFLDIQYGSFGAEVLLWTIVFFATLRAGWRQQGQINDSGRRWQKVTFAAGGVLFIFLFVPMWGFPRAGLYLLAVLQASYNCITVTRRHLHLSLLISAVMVMFAASHYRADWTMLFYLVPFVAAVVFTLVAEQINRQANDLRQQSLGKQVIGAQGVAIAAATATILAIGGILYAVTPQSTWWSLMWNWGQPASVGPGGIMAEIGQGGTSLGGGSGQGAEAGGQATGSMGAGSGWLTPDEMRQAARRPGMPGWQAEMINSLADTVETLEELMRPVMKSFTDLWEALKKWMKENMVKVVGTIAALALLALLIAAWYLLREAKAGTWIHTRFDYLRFVVLGQGATGASGARQLYAAMERLFELHDDKRSTTSNTREYLAQLAILHRSAYRELSQMTHLFENARYGAGPFGEDQLSQMRDTYRKLYLSTGRFDTP